MLKIAKFGREMLWNAENIALRNLQILYSYKFVLRAGKCTTFGSKVVHFPVRNTKSYKICKFRRAIFSSFYNISQSNFAILLILTCSSSCGDGFCSSCLDQNLVYSIEYSWESSIGIAWSNFNDAIATTTCFCANLCSFWGK
jgi:hypothetical protein